MPSRHQSKPSPQWQEYVWRATLPGQRGSGAAGSRPLRWVDGASGSAAVSLRRSKAIEPASRPKSHGISVSALGPVAPNAASKVGGAMVEACRIRQGPAHFTRPPVACRFAPIVWVPSYWAHLKTPKASVKLSADVKCNVVPLECVHYCHDLHERPLCSLSARGRFKLMVWCVTIVILGDLRAWAA